MWVRKLGKGLLLLLALTGGFLARDVVFAQAPAPEANNTHPARLDLPSHWQKQYVQDPDFGSRIFVVQTGTQNRQTVLLIHGLGQSGLIDWLDVIPQLEKKYHVIALDLPGFGNSHEADGRLTPTRYAKVIKNLLDSLDKTPSNSTQERPIIVGHSLGGAVALRFAAFYPDQLSRLVLVDVAGILERTAFLKLNTALPSSVDTQQSYITKRVFDSLDYLRSSMVEQSGFAPDPINAAFRSDDAWRMLVGDSPNMNAALALFTENFSDAVYSMKTPTALIWGSNDRVAPLRTARLLASRLPQAQFALINGASHVPMKSHADLFMATLQAALEQPIVPGRLWRDPAEPVKNLTCKRVYDATYSGRYKNIILNGCRHVTFYNVQAEKIIAERSDITLDNVTLTSPDIAIDSRQSLITATNVDISAPIGIQATRSRLDLAGVDIVAGQQALAVKLKTRVIMSVSRIHSPLYEGYAHGAFSLRDTSLEKTLATPRP